MRSVVALTALIAAIVLLAPPSVLATELDQFMAKVAKSAPNHADVTPPVICVCKDGTPRQNHAGQLFSFTDNLGGGLSVRMQCQVPVFDPASEELNSLIVCDIWELLPK